MAGEVERQARPAEGLTPSVLIQIIETFAWASPSPDPTGIAYLPSTGTILVCDSEVDEVALFVGDNLFEMAPTGEQLTTADTLAFSNEPTGLALDPATEHLFVGDDDANAVFELDPGPDAVHGTPDDIVTSFATDAFGSSDPEGVAFDTDTGDLFVVDGSTAEVYRISPGTNGVFDGVPPAGDDTVTQFDTAALGVTTPSGIAFAPDSGLLYIVGKPADTVAEITRDGNLERMIDVSTTLAREPSGVAYAPSSQDPAVMSLYITDSGVNDATDPTENDGKVYELSIAPRSGDEVDWPRLLRNAAFPRRSRTAIFTGPNPGCRPSLDPTTGLDPFGVADCVASPWPELDDDDTHATPVCLPTVDPEIGIASDATRPLVFYQLDVAPSVGNQMLLWKERSLDTVGITISGDIPRELSKGIPFGPFNLPRSEFGQPFTGAWLDLGPSYIMDYLADVQVAGMTITASLAGSRRHTSNPDGTFSLDLWKARIDRYLGMSLEPFVSNGTFALHYLVDEPKSASRWGDVEIPNAVLDELARYSKQYWPALKTAVREEPTKLEREVYEWVYLDTAWAQYSARKGPIEDYAVGQAYRARKHGLGLVVGLNVLVGGDGSSAVPSPAEYPGNWSMSPDELRTYGSVLLDEPYACMLIMWRHDLVDYSYFARPEIMDAMRDLSALAANRCWAPCVVH